MSARSASLLAAAGTFIAASCQAQCYTGSYKCDEVKVGDVGFSRTSSASLEAECVYRYTYTIWCTTGGESVEVGGSYVPNEGAGGITVKPRKKALAHCGLLGTVSFTSERIPKIVKGTFSPEADGVSGAVTDLDICVPGKPCEKQEERKQSGGTSQVGPDEDPGKVNFESRYVPEARTIVFMVSNTGNYTASFDWVGLREIGVADLRGVLAPGQRAMHQVPATAATEMLLELDTEFQNLGGLIAPVATIVPQQQQPCYADCDRNGRLDIRDFFCFQAAFANGNAYADCDGNGRHDIRDFFCYQAKFAAGCR